MWSKPNSRRSGRSRRSRGSILVIVVAILTMIALIGTAFIATTAFDRQVSEGYVARVGTEMSGEHYLDHVQQMIERELREDAWRETLDRNGRPWQVDSPLTDTWLGDRLPELWPGSPPNQPMPMWLHLSGAISRDIPENDFRSPLQFNGSNGLVPNNYGRFVGLAPQSVMPVRFGALPDFVSIQYPPDYPIETLRNQVRTYPALRFVSAEGGASRGRLIDDPAYGGVFAGEFSGPYLAADADGDGIADSVLFRVGSAGDGTVYYAAIRIIDNNSAINVNTAWSRDFEFTYTGGGARVPADPNTFGNFFTSSIGLRELLVLDNNLDGSVDSNERLSPSSAQPQMSEINRYRFGYSRITGSEWSLGASPPGGTGAAGGMPFTTNYGPTYDYQGRILPSIESDIGWIRRLDFVFANQGEALFTQLGRRLASPGYHFSPNDTSSVPVRYRPFSEEDAASLAYRFCMLRYDANGALEVGELENVVASVMSTVGGLDSLVQTAPNFVRSAGTPRFNSFPANEIAHWFAMIRQDQSPISYGSSLAAGVPRSIRTLLTTCNATSTMVAKRYQDTFQWFPLVSGPLRKMPEMLNPGMLVGGLQPLYGAVNSNEPQYRGINNGPYNVGDIVSTLSGLCYMKVATVNADGSTCTGTTEPDPLVYDSNRDPRDPGTPWNGWDLQPYSTGDSKVSINTAGFPELWRGFFHVMTREYADNGTPPWLGSPMDQQFIRDAFNISGTGPTGRTIREAFYNPTDNNMLDIYHGMKFNSGTFVPPADQNPLRMFRSPLRDPRTTASASSHRMTPYQVALLRSALAAVNAMDLRDNDEDITVRTITLYDVDSAGVNPSGGHPGDDVAVPLYQVTVYGHEKQPYITAVYCSTDTHSYGGSSTENKHGYVAIELFNPHDTQISLKGYKFAVFPRTPNIYGTNDARLTLLDCNLDSITIDPGKRVILENYDSTEAGAAKYRPPPIKDHIQGTPRFVKGLADDSCKNSTIPNFTSQKETCFDRELILLRPRIAGSTASPVVQDMVPVDQFDFTGIALYNRKRLRDGATEDRAHSYFYARAANDSTHRWRCVYPGRYDGSLATRRHQGVRMSPAYNPGAGEHDDWNPNDATAPFTPGNNPPADVKLGDDDRRSPTYDTASDDGAFNIQLSARDMPGPKDAGRMDFYPIGGFARNGDMLQIPYIGAYRVRLLKRGPATLRPNPDMGELEYWSNNAAEQNRILEINSVTIDAAFAEDTVLTNNDADEPGAEQIGRFAPPFNIPGGAGADPHEHYAWAARLFDYFDVSPPSDDYLPQASPDLYVKIGANRVMPQPIPSAGQPYRVNNDPFLLRANDAADETVGQHGRININTAPPRVLAMVPWVFTSSAAGVARNESIVAAIHGGRSDEPYWSVFDLNRLSSGGAANFRNGWGGISGGNPDENHGDYSPLGDSDNDPANDFEFQYAMINRVSNMVTTRSDTFTCYIVVQGWREDQTPFPAMVWEQRRAFILDRSGIRPGGGGNIKRIPIRTD